MTLDAIGDKLQARERLTPAEARELASTSDIIGLGMLADEARRRRHGDRTTFLRVAHVSVDAAEASIFAEEAGELRLEGAPHSIDAAASAVRVLVSRAGSTPVAAFSLADLSAMAGRTAISLDNCFTRLKEAGLDRIATGSPDAPDFLTAFEAAVNAGLIVDRVRFAHAADDWLARMHDVVKLQDATSMISAVSPLPPRRPSAAPTTGYDDLKKVALARLLADNIRTIQVDWAQYGPKLAQVALTFGADDLDDVPAVEDASLGPRRTPIEEVRRNIRAASLVPVERNGRFELKI